MTISSVEEASTALTAIGYYRLRGYSFHLYDNAKVSKRSLKVAATFVDIIL